MTVSLINSGMGHHGHSWSRETMDEIYALQAREEQTVPTDFNGLARWMGYKPHLIRNAIGRATSRASVIERIRAAGYRFQGNPECLADAYLAEIAASVPSFAEAAE